MRGRVKAGPGALLCLSLAVLARSDPAAAFPVPPIKYDPSVYAAARTATAPVIDGALDDPCWGSAAWTQPFVDIEGALKPAPRFVTRAKMVWDDDFFYVAAEMEEPDLWATYTERDAVIFHENDFEVFIDPDGDTHEYYELEINALNTVWDLFLVKPYRDGGPAVNAWDIAGLRTAVSLNGTLNDPGDRDQGWTVEIAMPWKVLAECAHRPAPPRTGDTWWINFSRVEWRRIVVDGSYVKSKDPRTGKDLPEDNWVWSAQGLIAMHYPEMWGIVTFVEVPAGTPTAPEYDIFARQALRSLYYAQKEFHEKNGRYALTLDELPPLRRWYAPEIRLEVCGEGYEASLRVSAPDGSDTYYRIRDDGRIWCDIPP